METRVKKYSEYRNKAMSNGTTGSKTSQDAAKNINPNYTHTGSFTVTDFGAKAEELEQEMLIKEKKERIHNYHKYGYIAFGITAVIAIIVILAIKLFS